jgi:hypothetical protein
MKAKSAIKAKWYKTMRYKIKKKSRKKNQEDQIYYKY